MIKDIIKEINETEYDPHFGNYFCLIPHTNLAFVAVSKNAVTFLKRVAYYHASSHWYFKHLAGFKLRHNPEKSVGYNALFLLKQLKGYARYGLIGWQIRQKTWLKDFRQTHDLIGYDENSPFLIPVAKMPAYEAKHGKLIKFAVWRDPTERIASTFKLYFMQQIPNEHYKKLGIQINDFGVFCKYLENEWKKPQLGLQQDEHIRPQVGYYQETDVDWVVHIDDVHKFLTQNNVHFIKERSNQSTKSFTIENAAILEGIQQYYAEDYQIKISYNPTTCVL